MEEEPREFEIPPPGDKAGGAAGSRRRFRKPASGSISAPTLGYVPAVSRAPAPTLAEPHGNAAIAYGQTIERLQAANTDDVFLVTAAGKASNAGDAALNLAVAATRHGLRTVLIDADASGEGPSRYLRTGAAPGLADLARGTAGLDEASRLLDVGEDRRLPMIPAGSDLGSAPLDGSEFADAVDRITEHSDLVLLAVPPSASDGHVSALGAHADGAILVVAAGESQRATQPAADRLSSVGAPVIGLIERANGGRRGRRSRR